MSPRRTVLGLETLEQRCLLAVDPIGALFKVSAAGAVAANRDAEQPSVVYNTADDRYAVVWKADTNVDGRTEVFGQLLDREGASVGAEFQVATMIDTDDAADPDIVYNPDRNEYLVVWHRRSTERSKDVFGQRLDASGNEIGADDFQISLLSPGKTASYSVAVYNPVEKQYLVLWYANQGGSLEGSTQVWGQKLDALGNAVGGNFQISNLGNGSSVQIPDVTVNSDNGDYFVVWYGQETIPAETSFEVWGQFLDSQGGELGVEFQITNATLFEAQALRPRVVYNAVGDEYLVVYYEGVVDEVFGQRISRSGAEIGPPDFQISDMASISSPGATTPDLIHNPDANEYLVVWGEVRGVTDTFARLLDGDGTPLAPQFMISDVQEETTDVNRDAATARVAYNPDDHQYLTVWEADGPPSQTADNVDEIFGRRWGMPVPPTVIAFTPTPSGFIVEFSDPMDASTLNLFDVETTVFGPSDVRLTGDLNGRITGSLVVAETRVTFVATGGPLPADAYKVRLRSAVDGFRHQSSGGLLDGDNDGLPGGDYTNSFTMAPQTVVVSLPDMARGPGQPVDIPATRSGLPLRITDADGVMSVDLTLLYDPSKLNITDVSLGGDAPPNSFVTIGVPEPGKMILSFFSAVPMPAGPAELALLEADVPDSAPYRTAHALDVTSLRVNEGGVSATADDAVHAVAYFGDTTGNGDYSGLDAVQIARVVVALDTGYQAYPLVDPVVIGDVTGNGDLSGLDAVLVAQEVVGLDPAEIPPLPSLSAPAGFPENGYIPPATARAQSPRRAIAVNTAEERPVVMDIEPQRPERLDADLVEKIFGYASRRVERCAAWEGRETCLFEESLLGDLGQYLVE
jgi:hypothetical protein